MIAAENEMRLTSAEASWGARLCASERLQQQHYDNINADYEAHYGDRWSKEYRRRFIHEPMFAGLELSGMRVLDALCGGGQTTQYLLEHGALVTGLDISEEAIDSFRSRWPEATAINRSLLDSGLPTNSFDCVVVVGGLHHLHPNVSAALREIHRILKPGGFFCFMEPHRGTFPDLVRQFWYKRDRFFSDNEAAIDLERLQQELVDEFTTRTVHYLGNVAFLLVLNSLIFRIPLSVKRFYSRTLIRVEAWISRLQGKRTSCFVTAQLQKSTSHK